MLTSTYAALYKTTSPLTLDWRSEEVASMMGHDSNLVSLFCNIKTEMFWFRKCSEEHGYANMLAIKETDLLLQKHTLMNYVQKIFYSRHSSLRTRINY
jgi:hypothetical protein